MKHHLPPSIALIQSISSQLDSILPCMQPHTPAAHQLKDILLTSEHFNTHPHYLNSPRLIRYTQVLLLVGMSMFGGVQVSCLRTFSDDGTNVRITWDTGTHDTFTWGEYNTDFTRFTRYYQDRLSSVPQHTNDLPTALVKGVDGFLTTYQVLLDTVAQKVEPLIGNKSQLSHLFNQALSSDTLFILLSSLPKPELNALFVYIQQYFPTDLSVTTPANRSVQVVSLFNSPTEDISYLLEKIHIYFDLYFRCNFPIIKEITQQKTGDYLKKTLQNSAVHAHSQAALRAILDQQITTRRTLYTLFKNHLATLT